MNTFRRWCTFAGKTSSFLTNFIINEAMLNCKLYPVLKLSTWPWWNKRRASIYLYLRQGERRLNQLRDQLNWLNTDQLHITEYLGRMVTQDFSFGTDSSEHQGENLIEFLDSGDLRRHILICEWCSEYFGIFPENMFSSIIKSNCSIFYI